MEEILPLAVWGERVVGFVRQGRTIGFGVQPSLKVFRMDFFILYFPQRSYLWDVNVGVVVEAYLVVRCIVGVHHLEAPVEGHYIPLLHLVKSKIEI